MKSFEKFQYDTSPYVNEEIEELDEISIVGMVRSAGQALKNSPVVKKGTELVNKVRSNISSPSPSVQNTPIEQKRNKLSNEINKQSKKVERVQQRSDKKITNAANNLSKSISRRREVVNRAKNMPLTMKRVQNNQTQSAPQTPISRRKEVVNRAKNMPLTVKRVQDNQNKNKGLSNVVSQTQRKRDDVVKRDAKIDQNIRDLKSDDEKVRAAAQKRTADDPSLNKPRLINRIKRFGYKDPDKAEDLTRGGIRSKLVRNVGSVAKAVGKGLATNPTNKVSYNAKGDGYSGAFGNIGDNIKNVGQEVLKAPTFDSTKEDPKTGKITKGEGSGTVGDRLGLTRILNREKENPSTKSSKVTGGDDDIGNVADAKRQEARRKRQQRNLQQDKVTQGSGQEKVTQGSGATTQAAKVERKKTTNPPTYQDLMKQQNTQLTDKSDEDIANTKDPGNLKKFTNKMSTNQNQNQSATGAVDKKGNPISRFGSRQPYVTYNIKDKNKKKNGKVTGDGYPTGDDATHWLDAQKQHSSKTPKLFEQFLSEIDTSSIKKKKKDGRGMHPHDEIKPMSGTNTITINPEDESSKYKRGY